MITEKKNSVKVILEFLRKNKKNITVQLKSLKNKVYFIAEIGSNHEGNFSDAKKS